MSSPLPLLILSDEPVPTEVRKLADEFRASADELVDLLDLKNPSTVKLKVGGAHWADNHVDHAT